MYYTCSSVLETFHTHPFPIPRPFHYDLDLATFATKDMATQPTMMTTNSKIIYTKTDEAPALATHSFLPIVQPVGSLLLGRE